MLRSKIKDYFSSKEFSFIDKSGKELLKENDEKITDECKTDSSISTYKLTKESSDDDAPSNVTTVYSLRSNIFDEFVTEITELDNTIYLGDTYKYSTTVNNCQYPIDYEIIVVLCSGEIDSFLVSFVNSFFPGLKINISETTEQIYKEYIVIENCVYIDLSTDNLEQQCVGYIGKRTKDNKDTFILSLRKLWSYFHSTIDERLFFSYGVEMKDDVLCLFSLHPKEWYHDISFWINPKTFCEQDFLDCIRNLTRDLVKVVKYLHNYEAEDKTSVCYRLIYQSIDSTLAYQECRDLQLKLRDYLVDKLKVEMR